MQVGHKEEGRYELWFQHHTLDWHVGTLVGAVPAPAELDTA